jgi:hypothetical protein
VVRGRMILSMRDGVVRSFPAISSVQVDAYAT